MYLNIHITYIDKWYIMAIHCVLVYTDICVTCLLQYQYIIPSLHNLFVYSIEPHASLHSYLKMHTTCAYMHK